MGSSERARRQEACTPSSISMENQKRHVSSHSMPLLFAGATLALVAAVATTPMRGSGLEAEPVTQRPSSENASTEGVVGSQTCGACHQEAADSHRLSVHREAEARSGVLAGCESCHGPGQAHVNALGDPTLIFSFAESDTVEEKVDRCVTCHEDDVESFAFRGSSHMKGTVDCASCHKPHAAAGEDRLLAVDVTGDPLRLGAGLEACLGCHQEVRATANLNERHRMLEGVVACADCHDQHEPSPRMRLGGFRQSNCTSCHTDKQGPFVFEHVSQRIDGCTSCHAPHGSVNRHMLSFQSVGDLCYSCHVEVPGFHKGGPQGTPLRFDSTTNCTNCHSSIHGSNLDPAFLR